MKTFLDEISKKIISLNYQFEDIKIVVPNKRAISFFKKSLSNNLSKPQFSPEIISIEKFIIVTFDAEMFFLFMTKPISKAQAC